MAIAKNLKGEAVTCTSVMFCTYFAKADALNVDAFRRCAVANDATDSKDVISLAAEGVSADVKIFEVVSYRMC